MKAKRKEIDNFLIELDKFIWENIEVLSEDNIFDFMIPLKAGVPSSFWPKDSIDLKVLIPYINKSFKISWWTRNRRGSNYIRRVAYKMEYIPVRANSYYEIFSKILSDKWNDEFKITGIKLKNFYRKNPWREFIIPKDYWQINYDMYFLGKYEIIE